MTKQEQIEEMAKLIRNLDEDNIEYRCKDKDKCENCWCCGKGTAEELYNAGYRKTITSDLASDTQNAFKEGYIKGNIDGMLLARKETAKEILNDLYFNLQDSVKGNVAKSNDYYNVIGWIEEIAKEYGVEVEE